ncbi:MAG: hypothetical protein N4A59_01150 [Marinifilum sp.]|jgi:hypothetical protein|nr:hypothetical protein [Marinifilum sp.]
MKKRKLLPLMLLSVLFSCSENKPEIDEELEGKGTLVINSKETGVKSSSGTSYELDDLKTAIITIEQNGEVLEGYDAKEVQLEKWGENSITISGIELDKGTAYSITEFELKNNDKATTFASPIDGSEAASWVQKALPINFDIKANETTEVEVQVVTTLGATPDDFGYNKFTFADKTPKVQAYLENIEAIFLGKGEKMVHHFTKRGIPTYSEVYRNHAINKHVTLDYIAETFKHYYIDDKTMPEKLVREIHTDGNLHEYQIINYHASGNIAKMETASSLWEINDKGLLAKYTSKNAAGVNDYGWSEYFYNDNGFLIERKGFNAEGAYTNSYKYTVDEEGKQLSRERVNANGETIYPKYKWFYTDGVESGREDVHIDDNGEEYIRYKYEYQLDASGLAVSEVEIFTYKETVETHNTEYIYEGQKLVKSITTNPDNSDYKKEKFYDELGYYENREDKTNVYDFRGRLIERHYQVEDYKIVEFYDMELEISEKRFYSLDGLLLKSIYPSDGVLREYWPNGKQKKYIRYNYYTNILEHEDLIHLEIDYKNPTEYKQFDLLNYIEYISEYNENGVRLSGCSIRNNRYETSNYPNGRIISVFERQYKKEGADYVTTIETTSDFYYYQGDYMYCAPNQLYQYTVYIENLATGEETFTAYDSNGNEM